MSIMARFAAIFSILQRSGVSILDSLDILSETINNAALEREFSTIKEKLRSGQGIAEPLGSARYFTPLTINMVAVGERAGNLETMLEDLAAHYDEEVEYAVGEMTEAIGPVLIVVLAAVVGFFALAIFMPMWDMTKLANGRMDKDWRGGRGNFLEIVSSLSKTLPLLFKNFCPYRIPVDVFSRRKRPDVPPFSGGIRGVGVQQDECAALSAPYLLSAVFLFAVDQSSYISKDSLHSRTYPRLRNDGRYRVTRDDGFPAPPHQPLSWTPLFFIRRRGT